jgi:Skp family chaperone for outer membrane proteins
MRWLLAVLVGMSLLGLAAVAAGAAPAPPAKGETRFAVVDMDKVMASYVAFAKAQDEFRGLSQETDRKIEANRRLRLLDDKEVQELKELRNLPVPKQQQSARLQQMEALSDLREQEFLALEQKGDNLTPQEKARKEELNSLAEKRAPEIVAEEKRLNDARKSRSEELSDPLLQAEQAAFAKVAKEKQVSMIFNKEVALWAELDLTDAVVAELNTPPKGK